MNRRAFLGGAAALGGVAMSGLSWSALAAGQPHEAQPSKRRPLVVKPVLRYETPSESGWRKYRHWGGIQTQADAEQEVARIGSELNKLQAAADFPLKFLPVSAGRNTQELAAAMDDVASADVVLFYAAGGKTVVPESIRQAAKDVIIFCRHESGPLYLGYEIVITRYLHQHTDELVLKDIDEQDVVIDSQEEILWRLRSLCGLRNTLGSGIVAVGGPAGGMRPTAWRLAKHNFQLDIKTVPYEELGRLVREARADQAAVQRARRRAEEYLNQPGTTLETERKFVDNAFLLESILRGLMKEAGCRAITINNCMDTIMPVAETVACLPLSTLNDDGYQAFCAADFTGTPAGMLLGNISGKPQFLSNPTFPHEGVITLAHCTGPRKMDGVTVEPARIMTHFESDYGAAPKVEMRKGQLLTHVVADFDAKQWVGLRGEIIGAPFLPICRDQINVRFGCDSLKLAQRMRGFHWVTCYGDYLKEVGYALKRIGIQWENLG